LKGGIVDIVEASDTTIWIGSLLIQQIYEVMVLEKTSTADLTNLPQRAGITLDCGSWRTVQL